GRIAVRESRAGPGRNGKRSGRSRAPHQPLTGRAVADHPSADRAEAPPITGRRRTTARRLIAGKKARPGRGKPAIAATPLPAVRRLSSPVRLSLTSCRGIRPRGGGATRDTPGDVFFPHFAPPTLTCGFVSNGSLTTMFVLVGVEQCGVQWGAVE